MKTFDKFCEANRPGMPINDRSMEAFVPLLRDLSMATKSLMNQNAKNEIWPVVNQLIQVVQKYQSIR